MRDSVTIKQIAKEAGVSEMTVSNVINRRKGKVSNQTLARIEKIIKKYNYTPNMNARALVTGSSMLLGVFFFSDKIIDFEDPFICEVLTGIESEAKKIGYFTLIYNVITREDVDIIQRNWHFDGIIAIGFNTWSYNELAKYFHNPTVFIDTYVDDESLEQMHSQNIPHAFINVDDFAVGKLAAATLILHGHKNIAFLSYEHGLEKSQVIFRRFSGYQSEVSKKGGSEGYFYDFSSLFESILQGRFSAFVASADILSIKWLSYIGEKGLHVPDFHSMVGIDNSRYTRLISPYITTIDLFHTRRGENAVCMLDLLIQGKEIESHSVYMPFSLVDGQTVRNL